MPTIPTPEDADSPLGKLLLKIVPENAEGNKTFTHLATLVPVSRNAICKWLVNQRVPAPRVKRLVEIADGSASVSDFEPFVYNY